MIVAPGLKADAAADQGRTHERVGHGSRDAHLRRADAFGQRRLRLPAEDGNDAEQLLAVADQRMYTKKQQHYKGEKKLIAFPARCRASRVIGKLRD